MPTTRSDRPERRASDYEAARSRRDKLLLDRYERTGDPALREELILRFEPLARSLAHRYASRSEPLEDLEQVAREGLIKAIDRYDSSRSTTFGSYATPVILGHIRHHFRDNTQRIHLSRGLQERTARVTEEIAKAQLELGRAPTADEIAVRTGLEAEKVEEALVANETRSPRSFEAPARADGESVALSELVGSTDRGFDRVEATLTAAPAELSERDRRVLWLRFGQSLTQRAIGERIGASQMQVSRILRRTLSEMLGSLQEDRAV